VRFSANLRPSARALIAYQAGVYPALAEADLHPDWVSGISIGAVNAALIAGNLPDARQTPEAEILAAEADQKVYNLIQLIYHAKTYEGSSKDYEFSRRMMEEHWSNDAVFTFDLAAQGRK
jgi:predicted acylesterase/phospholipase RssA